MRNPFGISSALVVAAASALAAEPVNDVAAAQAALVATINKGKACNVASFDKDQLNCTYTVGTELLIEISGVGDKKAVVAFPRANESKGSRFTASVGLSDGCIRVKSWDGITSIAFISPKDGKVYQAPGAWCSWFAGLR